MKKQLAKILDRYGRIIVRERNGDDPTIFAEPMIDETAGIGFATEDTWLFSISIEDIKAITDWVEEIADSLEENNEV